MVAFDVEQARFNMVEQQIRPWDVLDERVLDLLFNVRREEFVPREYRALAFADLEIPLSDNARMWTPKMEARVLQELALTSNDRVLEIGTGSGYFTALMASQAGEIESVEIDPRLATEARARLARHQYRNTRVIEGDGARGYADGTYDVIVLTGSTPALPERFFEQLKRQGRGPQARAGLLPNVSATGVGNINDFHEEIHADLPPDTPNPINRTFRSGTLAVSASQPLYRLQNKVAYDQAKQQVSQADYQFSWVQQDLILRVAQAYFDVLLAEFNVDLAVSQKAALSENLAQPKRNVEVGVATITDTNEAQAKYDSIVAQEISARNDLDNRRTALRAIIGRAPNSLKKLGAGFDPPLPSPNSPDYWVDRALADNLAVRIAGYNFDIATLEVDRQRAGHYPTLDLVASYSAQYGTGATKISSTFDLRQ